ncbi:hypothetical protein BH23GEM10_BH23GEM10_08450 [soil metagenome]
MTPVTPSLGSLIDAARRIVRRDTAVAVALLALSVLPLALLGAWLAGLRWPWRQPGAGPLLFDLMIIAAVGGLIAFGIRRWLAVLDERAVAADAERTAGMAEGSVSGVLELGRQLPDGMSPALALRAERAMTGRFAGAAPSAMAAQLGRTARRRRHAATMAFCTLTLATGLLAFVAPEHARSAWAPLANPVRSMTASLPPLVVTPGDAEVTRGADLDVRVQAVGREIVTLRWQMEGDVPREAVATVAGDSAVVSIPRVGAATSYQVHSPDGAASPRYRVTPVDELLLSQLSVDVVYPPHVHRAPDHFEGELPPLDVPEGTQLVISGRATRPLSAASLDGVDAATVFAVDGDVFHGTFAPRSSGLYPLTVRTRSGAGGATRAALFEITVERDAASFVTVTFPAIDTILDASLQQAVVADARDDYGVASGALVSWRVSRTGARGPDVVTPL